MSYQNALDTAGRDVIMKAIVKAKGNRARAARALGLSTSTFYREVERLELWPAFDGLARKHGWPSQDGQFARVSTLTHARPETSKLG